MEVFYCKECRSRVSSFDLDSGKGKEISGAVYCSKCLKNAVIPEAEVKAARRVASTVTAKKPQKKTTSRYKVNPHAVIHSAPPVKKGNPALIVFVVVLVLALGGAAVFFLSKKKEQPLKKAESTDTVYKLDTEDPVKIPDPENKQPDPDTGTPPNDMNKTDPEPEKSPDPEKPDPVDPEPVKVTEAPIPDKPDKQQFVSRLDWTDLSGSDWASKWETVYGDWAYDEILAGLTDEGMGSQALKTRDYSFVAYEFGVVFAIDKPAEVEFGFHRKEAKGGRLKIENLTPGKWHTVEWQVARSEVKRILVNGKEIEGNSSITLYTGNMSSEGAIEVRTIPNGVASCTLAIAEMGIRFNEDALWNGPHPEPYILENGKLAFEAEAYSWRDRRNDSVDVSVSTKYAGFSGKGYIATDPRSGNRGWDSGCEAGYKIECVDPGRYYVWLKRYIEGGKDNSVFIGLDGRGISSREVDNQTYVKNKWHWYRHETPLKIDKGSHDLLIRKREPGYRIDRIILTADPDFLPPDTEDWTFGNNLFKDGTLDNLRSWKKWKNEKGISAFKSKVFGHNAGRVEPDTHWGYENKGTFEADTLYRLKVKGRKPDGGKESWVGVAIKASGNDNVLRRRITFTSTEWEQREMVFRTPKVKTWNWSAVFVTNESETNFLVTKIRLEKLPGSVLPETSLQDLRIGAGGRIFQETNGLVIMEAEGHSSSEKTDSHGWEVHDDENASNLKVMIAAPNTDTAIPAESIKTSPRMDFRIQFKTAGPWIVWLRGYGKSSKDDSCHVGLDGEIQKTSKDADLPRGRFGWYSKRANNPGKLVIEVSEPGEHVLNIWMREDGAVLDRIILTQNIKFDPDSIPLKEGPPLVSMKTGFDESDFTLNGSAKIVNKRIRLTEKKQDQAGSAFYKERVDITSFKTSFTFRIKEAEADGLSFVLQNQGFDSLGKPGGSLGVNGTKPAFGVGFSFWDKQKMKIYEGDKITKRIELKGIDLKSGHLYRVDLDYNGKTLNILLVNEDKKLAFPYTLDVSIPVLVKAREAFAGFSGGTGGRTAIQEIISWEYDEK